MGLRQGVTASEENHLKKLVSEGLDWDEICALIDGSVATTKKQSVSPAFMDGVDLRTVKTGIYDPLVKKLAEAKKNGHDSIHKYEAAEKAKLAKGNNVEKLKDEASDLREQLDAANKKLADANKLLKDQGPSLDDLTGKKKL